MLKKNVHRIGVVAKSMVEVLSRHRGGLPFAALREEVRLHNGVQDEQDMRRGAIAMIKAGWLIDQRGRWEISAEGEKAHSKFRDPGEFLSEAAKRSVKGWLSVNSPYYIQLAKNIEKLTVEFKAIRRVGLRRAFGKSLKTSPWEEVLPIQAPRLLEISDLSARTLDELILHLDSVGASYAEGGHAIYLPPSSIQTSAFSFLAAQYPSDSGLKIIKTPGGIDQGGSYVKAMTNGDSYIHLKLIHSPKHLTLVANLFFDRGVGPRLYDFVELQFGGQLWTAYVTQHVPGRTPTLEECQKGVDKLRELEKQEIVKVLLPEGFDDVEFECPSCSSNALTDDSGRFKYIDFQNFLLVKYQDYLTGIAREAGEESHFGDETLRRGGRYLYQSVPGVSLPGKRGIEDRMIVLGRLLEQANLSVQDRLVLDVGCNIGMMMAQYLKMGARWCHGWDRARVTHHTEKVLSALGCTRFSTTGGDIIAEQPLVDNLPLFLRTFLDGCVISYLAVRGHIGFLRSLAHIPWSFVIYEGHESETQEEFDEHMAEFRKMADFKVAAFSFYSDGDSDRRPVAILVRNTVEM